jgi:hypothetical protein
MFRTHDGRKDIKTMTDLMQLRFQCDADLGGNLDNKHSQTSYLGYLAGNVICRCSTDQGSVSTGTAESEIKAVNHILKAEVAAAQVPHITRGLRHLDLAEHYLKEKTSDGTCLVVKVALTTMLS